MFRSESVLQIKQGEESSMIVSMSITKKNKCLKVRPNDDIYEDRLSALPDDLIISILSLLPTKEAVKTNILSKRWRSVYSCVPLLDFDTSFTSSMIDNVLAHHKAIKIVSFSLSRSYIPCPYGSDYAFTSSEQLNSYVQFAMHHKVEVLSLNFLGNYGTTMPLLNYNLPDYVFQSNHLTKMDLGCCVIPILAPDSIHLGSLKTLVLRYIDVSQQNVENLIRNCRCLVQLDLIDCNIQSDSMINITNPNIRNLFISDPWCENSVKLYAPHVLHITFFSSLRRNYIISNVDSIISVEFSFDSSAIYCYEKKFLFSTFFDLLCDIKCSKISFGYIATQVLSEMELLGNRYFLMTEVDHVKLETGLTKFEIPGLLFLLRMFTTLNVLVLNIQPREMFSTLYGEPFYDEDDFKGNDDLATFISPNSLIPKIFKGFDEEFHWLRLRESIRQVPGLKTIILNGFSRPKYVYLGLTDFFKVHKREIRLVEVILKHSLMLETLEINFQSMHNLNKPRKLQFVWALASKLLKFCTSPPPIKQISSERILFSYIL